MSDEMISYHGGDPNQRFVQYLKDPIPKWAKDVRPHTPSEERDMTDLLDRLRKVDGSDEGTHWYRNPDGPEAAAEIERLRGMMADSFIHRRCIKAEADLAEAEALLREAKTILYEAKREVLIWLSDDCAIVGLIDLCIGRIDARLARREPNGT